MRYPIGTQDFRTLREDGAVYVDKTEHICRVCNAGRYFFLSRPRRFGKSLTVSTLKELYSGDRELFRGLWAYDHWDFPARQRPVVWIRFASSDFQSMGLERALHYLVDREAARLGVTPPAGGLGYAARFQLLIEAVAKTHPSGRCVVLVDEYDKPIIEYFGSAPAKDLPQTLSNAEANRDLLRPFYGVLKDADPYIELVFVTGVSAFSKISLFSDLNNIRQLTLDSLAHTLVGLTEDELTAYFEVQIAATGYSREEVRRWYNGYTWGGERVYNPWSILQFLATGQRDNYWSSSGTPKFVTDLLARDGAYDFEGQTKSVTELTGFNLDHLDPVGILWQGGYLTLGEGSEDFAGKHYQLRYPNMEVRQTFTSALLSAYGFDRPLSAGRVSTMYRALTERDPDAFAEELDVLYAHIPNELWQGATERFYHAIVHTAFTLAGTTILSEVSTRRGRADVIVEAPPYLYALEFKLLRPTAAQLADEALREVAAEALAQEALAQIEQQGYLEPYRAGERGVAVAWAVVFDAERRGVAVVREGRASASVRA